MNDKRRRRINLALDRIEKISDTTSPEALSEVFRQVAEEIKLVAGEEQRSLDLRPESLMYSDVSMNMQDNACDLEIACNLLFEVAADPAGDAAVARRDEAIALCKTVLER